MSDAGEIIKSGAVEKIADLVNKLAGPMAEEVGMLLGDKVKVYRVQNWIKTVQKTERLLLDAGLPVNAVPPRLFLPIMEASSIEDNETLQDMWAGLLATASQDTDTVSPSFVETLKQLTPTEAKYLQRLYDDTSSERRKHDPHGNGWVGQSSIPRTRFEAGSPERPDTFERLGLIRRRYSERSEEETLIDVMIYGDELNFEFMFTEYGAGFLQACQGPSAANSASDASTPE
jgi:hypothetical protein